MTVFGAYHNQLFIRLDISRGTMNLIASSFRMAELEIFCILQKATPSKSYVCVKCSAVAKIACPRARTSRYRELRTLKFWY
jgi:hypothetical protein